MSCCGSQNSDHSVNCDEEIQSPKRVALESPEPQPSPKRRKPYYKQTSYASSDKPSSPPRVSNYTLRFDPVWARREFAKAVVLHDYPLSIFGHTGFKKLFFNLYPEISQETLRKDILKIYKTERDCSRELLGDADSRLAITTHMWVSCDQTRRYLAITGCMINCNWDVERRMIRFVNVPCTYTSELLANITLECVSDLGVTENLSTIAIENNNSNDSTLTDVLINKLPTNSLILGGKFLLTDCFARTISSMVKIAFEVTEDVIKKIRDMIIFWTATPERETQLKQEARNMFIKHATTTNNLVLDSASKWDTTFLMLQKSLLYKPVFSHLGKDGLFGKVPCVPSEEEWNLLEEVCQRILGFLHFTMTCISKHQTTNLGMLRLCEVKLALSKWVQSENVVIKEMASKMLEKFDKYWHTVRDTFAIAAILDPRLQLYFVSFYFGKIYSNDEAQREVDHIRELFYSLFDEYKAKMDPKEIQGESSPPRPSDSDDSFAWYKWHNLCNKRSKEAEIHEFDKYTERENFQPHEKIEDFDVLGWWKDKCGYPILNKMARDFLAIPICSVPPENVFDVGDSVLSPNRSRLDPAMVETLMCTQSWLWTDLNGSYAITNSYEWGTSVDDAAIEDHTGESESEVLSNNPYIHNEVSE